MEKGVYAARKKNGTVYYRSNIVYANKHVSLGSFSCEADGARAYRDAARILGDESIDIDNLFYQGFALSEEKAVVLLNLRDNKLYCKTPIYLRNGYFSYFLSSSMELKFDIDDLFYYSSHKIQRRKGHLFVSDYGMQYSILSRYGIRPYAVAGRDYSFANGDCLDFRYSNIIIENRYHGVQKSNSGGREAYNAVLHLNGNFKLGSYETEEEAAIAYNKAVDLARQAGFGKNFPTNYVDTLSPREYAEIYTSVPLSKNFLSRVTPPGKSAAGGGDAAKPAARA